MDLSEFQSDHSFADLVLITIDSFLLVFLIFFDISMSFWFWNIYLTQIMISF